MAVEPHEFEAHGGGTERAERQELQAKPDIPAREEARRESTEHATTGPCHGRAVRRSTVLAWLGQGAIGVRQAHGLLKMGGGCLPPHPRGYLKQNDVKDFSAGQAQCGSC